MVRKTGEVIVRHEMPNISFASLGEAVSIAFITPDRYYLNCHILLIFIIGFLYMKIDRRHKIS